MKPGPEEDERDVDWEEPPPFLASWQHLYAIVVIYTIVVVFVLYVLTIRLNR